MRILILSWEYPPLVYGGLGRHVHALAEAQAAAGPRGRGRHPGGRRRPRRLGVNGVRVVRVAPDPPALPMSDLLAWVMSFEHALTRAALRVAEDLRPDVVHGHDWLVAHTATAVKERYGIPLVATVHATEAGRHQGWLPGPLNKAVHTVEWWLTFEARRVITCSSHMRWEVTRLFDLPPDSVDVIPNGIDLERWDVDAARSSAGRASTYASDGPLLVFTGRLEWEKGCHTLLDALPRLRRRHPGLRLVVAGEGSQGADLRAHARRLRLGRSVAFLGLGPAGRAGRARRRRRRRRRPVDLRAVRAGGARGGGVRHAAGGRRHRRAARVRRARHHRAALHARRRRRAGRRRDRPAVRRPARPPPRARRPRGAGARLHLGRHRAADRRGLRARRPRGARPARRPRAARRPPLRLVVRDGNLLADRP